MTREIKDEFLKKILDGNRQAAAKLVEEWAEVHGYERAVREILEPALSVIGEKWSTTKDISLAQGYVAGKVTEDIMEKAAAQLSTPRSVSETKGPVVIGNIEDDCHELGRKLVTIFLRLDGWKVYDLGVDVLAAEFVDKAVDIGAPIVAASAMMYRTAINIKRLREEIDKRDLTGKVLLAAGGAVFCLRPELLGEVGAEGTAQNALKASALMERLLEKVCRK